MIIGFVGIVVEKFPFRKIWWIHIHERFSAPILSPFIDEVDCIQAGKLDA